MAYADPHFANVSLLLHFNGANGSTTFTDSSLSARTVTPNGIISIQGNEGFFNNNGHLTVPHSSAFSANGQAFSADADITLTDFLGISSIFGKRPSGTPNSTEWQFFVNTLGRLQVVAWDASSALVLNLHPTLVLSTGVKYRVRCSRSAAGVWRIFCDGALLDSLAESAPIGTNSATFAIGEDQQFPGARRLRGTMDNIRFTSGVERDSASYTAGTSEFPDALDQSYAASGFSPVSFGTPAAIVAEDQTGNASGFSPVTFGTPVAAVDQAGAASGFNPVTFGTPQASQPGASISYAWSKQTVPSTAGNRPGYGAGLFVSPQITGASVRTSVDGITWTLHSIVLPASGTWSNPCWNGSVFVMVRLNSTQAAYSADGMTWTESGALPASTSWRRVAWSPSLGLFLAVSQGGIWATSPDGITWTSRTAPFTGTIDVAWNDTNGLFIAFSATAIWTSPDGINWTNRGAGAGNSMNGIACLGALTVITRGVNFDNNVAYSTDGVTWNGAAAGPYTWTAAVSDGSSILITSNIGDRVLKTQDGASWTTDMVTPNDGGAGDYGASSGGASPITLFMSSQTFMGTYLRGLGSSGSPAQSGAASSFNPATFGTPAAAQSDPPPEQSCAASGLRPLRFGTPATPTERAFVASGFVATRFAYYPPVPVFFTPPVNSRRFRAVGLRPVRLGTPTKD